MAERAWRHHRVGAGFERLLDRLDQLAESQLLSGLDDREPAALDLRGIVDRLAAAGLDGAGDLAGSAPRAAITAS